jgi:hypothetical protein
VTDIGTILTAFGAATGLPVGEPYPREHDNGWFVSNYWYRPFKDTILILILEREDRQFLSMDVPDECQTILQEPKAAALIFRSGKIVCTGANSIENVTTALQPSLRRTS